MPCQCAINGQDSRVELQQAAATPRKVLSGESASHVAHRLTAAYLMLVLVTLACAEAALHCFLESRVCDVSVTDTKAVCEKYSLQRASAAKPARPMCFKSLTSASLVWGG